MIQNHDGIGCVRGEGLGASETVEQEAARLLTQLAVILAESNSEDVEGASTIIAAALRARDERIETLRKIKTGLLDSVSEWKSIAAAFKAERDAARAEAAQWEKYAKIQEEKDCKSHERAEAAESRVKTLRMAHAKQVGELNARAKKAEDDLDYSKAQTAHVMQNHDSLAAQLKAARELLKRWYKHCSPSAQREIDAFLAGQGEKP